MEFARRKAKRNEVMARPRNLNTRQSFLIPPEKLPYRKLFSFCHRAPSLGRNRKNFIRNNESTEKASTNIINPDGNFICIVGTSYRDSASYFRRFKRYVAAELYHRTIQHLSAKKLLIMSLAISILASVIKIWRIIVEK